MIFCLLRTFAKAYLQSVAARRPHRVVALAHRQGDPFVPFDWAECQHTATVVQLDIERDGGVRGHLAEGLRRRANVDRLPVTVEH